MPPGSSLIPPPQSCLRCSPRRPREVSPRLRSGENRSGAGGGRDRHRGAPPEQPRDPRAAPPGRPVTERCWARGRERRRENAHPSWLNGTFPSALDLK